MTHSAEAPFEIEVSIHSEKRRLTVKTEETTDGAPYYICSDGEDHVAEVRKETNGQWVQLWGDVDEESIEAIGEAIDAQPR